MLRQTLADQIQDPSLSDPGNDTGPAKTRVLLVMEDADDRQLIGQALDQARGQAFELDSVPTVADAIHRLGNGTLDVVLLDLVLPDSQGLTTFLKLQSRTGHVPVIVHGFNWRILSPLYWPRSCCRRHASRDHRSG